jgi:hypothetical protein
MSSRIARQKIRFLQRSTTRSDYLLGMHNPGPQSQRKMWLLTGQRTTLCAQKIWLETKPINYGAGQATTIKKTGLRTLFAVKKD